MQSQSLTPLIIPMGFNSLIGITNRILQIYYYYYTNHRGDFQSSNIKSTALTFCILPSALNFFMITIYCIFHYEEKLTPKVKLKYFFWYIFSCEFLYPIGVHRSFTTKYSYNADNPIITMRLVNAIHFMFVALPQLLVVSINSSARGNFFGVDITSLLFSAFYMVWSVGYYFYCIANDEGYDNLISNCVKDKNE